MLSQIKSNIKADFIVIYNSNLVKGALLFCFLILSFIVYTSSSIISDNCMAGYFINQMYITLTLFTVSVIIIIGSFLGVIDYSCQSFCLRVVNSNRVVLSISRILTIVIMSTALFLVHFVIGTFFDSFSGTVESISLNVCLKAYAVVLIVVFWGNVSYLFSFASRSFSVTSSVIIGYLLIESIVDQFLPQAVLCLLPVWNQKNLLKNYCPLNEGAVAIIQQNFGDYRISFYLMSFYTVISIGCIIILGKRRQY